MDETTNDQSAWVLASLGNSIATWVDRTVNAPQVVHDASQQYGIAADGSLYAIGQVGIVKGTTASTVTPNSTVMLLVGALILFVLAKN